jgi:hypothetical protein
MSGGWGERRDALTVGHVSQLTSDAGFPTPGGVHNAPPRECGACAALRAELADLRRAVDALIAHHESEAAHERYAPGIRARIAKAAAQQETPR